MTFVVIYDADVLYGDEVRDLLIWIVHGRTRPPKSFAAVLDALERAGLGESAALLRD